MIARHPITEMFHNHVNKQGERWLTFFSKTNLRKSFYARLHILCEVTHLDNATSSVDISRAILFLKVGTLSFFHLEKLFFDENGT